ncbi:Long-chain-fatty-acid--CoA ligase (EC 6.2.1.3) [Azospirillum argentinense]
MTGERRAALSRRGVCGRNGDAVRRRGASGLRSPRRRGAT